MTSSADPSHSRDVHQVEVFPVDADRWIAVIDASLECTYEIDHVEPDAPDVVCLLLAPVPR